MTRTKERREEETENSDGLVFIFFFFVVVFGKKNKTLGDCRFRLVRVAVFVRVVPVARRRRRGRVDGDGRADEEQK